MHPDSESQARGGVAYQKRRLGYYNKSNWDSSGRSLLAQEVPWRNAYLRPDLVANVGYFAISQCDGVFHPVDQTRAWNWQMGSQFQ